jgi:hypothetical protein
VPFLGCRLYVPFWCFKVICNFRRKAEIYLIDTNSPLIVTFCFTFHNVYIISVFSSPDPKSHASTQVLPSLSSYINFYILIFFSIFSFLCIRNQREIVRRKNYIIQLPILASWIVYTTDWELQLLVISLKDSIYYFINNIWYKYTGITKQNI